MTDPASSGPAAETVYRPHGVMLWLHVLVTVVFFGLGGALLIPVFVSPGAVAALVLAALFLWAFAAFFLLNLTGLRAEHLTLRADGLAFALPALGWNITVPWLLRHHELPWSAVRAVDVKLHGGGSGRVFVLRTAAGDFVFFWPQWPEADAISEEIIRRAGAATSREDMSLPPVADPAASRSGGVLGRHRSSP